MFRLNFGGEIKKDVETMKKQFAMETLVEDDEENSKVKEDEQ